MKLLELGKSKRARVCFDEVPELVIHDYNTSEMHLQGNTEGLNEERFFVLELLLPANASYYAVLGAKYIPIAVNRDLSIEIRYTEDSVVNYVNTLVRNKKTVFIGLPKEYVRTVLNTTMDYFQDNEIPSGKIVFELAAHCEIGSSPVMFKIVTNALLNILLNKDFPVSDIDVKEICEKSILSRVNPVPRFKE